MTQQVVLDRETIAGNIVKFAKDNKLKIHPGQEPLKWADLLIKRGGHCPCVPGRSHCPCDFVLEDIKELGRCRCGLFVNGAYIEEYNRLTSELNRKKKWTRKPRGSSLRKSA
jgi:hypothetical protein